MWVRAGTYSLGAAATTNVSAVNGTTADYIVLEGYSSTRGDQPVGSNRPLFNCATVIFGNDWSSNNIQWVGSTAGDMFQTLIEVLLSGRLALDFPKPTLSYSATIIFIEIKEV